MAQLFLLGPQISDVALVRGDLERYPRHHHTIAAQAVDLVRIVSEQAYFADAKVADDLRADSIIAQVFFESELQIRFDGIETGVLQRIRANLVSESDPAPFLMQID